MSVFDHEIRYVPKIKKNKYLAKGSVVGHDSYKDTPVMRKKMKQPNMYEAFEMMHKQDGTSDGRPKCDFAL